MYLKVECFRVFRCRKLNLFVESESFQDDVFREFHAAFYSRHSSDELRPHVFREPFFAAEACELAAVADVLAGVVFRGRCPARDDVFDAYQFVFVAVSAEDAESGSEAISDALKADEGPSPVLPQRGGDFAAPMRAWHFADVQRVVVTHT